MSEIPTPVIQAGTAIILAVLGLLAGLPKLTRRNAAASLAETYQKMGLELTEKYLGEIARLEQKLTEKDARLDQLDEKLTDLARHSAMVERYNLMLVTVLTENHLPIPSYPQ